MGERIDRGDDRFDDAAECGEGEGCAAGALAAGVGDCGLDVVEAAVELGGVVSGEQVREQHGQRASDGGQVSGFANGQRDQAVTRRIRRRQSDRARGKELADLAVVGGGVGADDWVRGKANVDCRGKWDGRVDSRGAGFGDDRFSSAWTATDADLEREISFTRINGDGDRAKLGFLLQHVANHATYHGLSLNIDMDLEPFSRINPCGYEGLAVTQMRNFGVTDKMTLIGEKLVSHLQRNLYPPSS